MKSHPIKISIGFEDAVTFTINGYSIQTFQKAIDIVRVMKWSNVQLHQKIENKTQSWDNF